MSRVPGDLYSEVVAESSAGEQRSQLKPGQGAEAFVVTPFMRLARTHIFGVAGDTLITIALAGSLFFSVSADAARGRVALYLALTIAPFAVVAPLIGPAIDRARGGRRLMMVATALIRAVVALVMVQHLESLWLYPEAFAMLVSGKAYHVAKSAIVPTLVTRDDELVEANSKLVLLGGIAGALSFIPGVGVRLLHPGLPLVLASAAFVVSGLGAWRLPSTRVAASPAGDLERAETRSGPIVLAASAMALLRAIVGFLTFLLVFWLRSEGASLVWFGVVGVAAIGGNLAGAMVAPVLRRVTREEVIMGGVMVVQGIVGFAVAAGPSRLSAAGLALTVGVGTSLGKLSFDAIVQRDAPDANQGRSFAKFETRFQLAWVSAALIPVLLFTILPIWLGFLIIAIASAIGAFFYLGGLRAISKGRITPGDRLKKRLLEDERVQRFGGRIPKLKRGVARGVDDDSGVEDVAEVSGEPVAEGIDTDDSALGSVAEPDTTVPVRPDPEPTREMPTLPEAEPRTSEKSRKSSDVPGQTSFPGLEN